jgi:hypothetical protein
VPVFVCFQRQHRFKPHEHCCQFSVAFFPEHVFFNDVNSRSLAHGDEIETVSIDEDEMHRHNLETNPTFVIVLADLYCY